MANPQTDPTVLVVSDNNTMRQMLQKLMKGSGFRVCLASSGAEALQVCGQGPGIDLVVMDVQRLGLDGPRTVDLLRLAGLTGPCCFITGKEAHGVKEDFLHRSETIVSTPFSGEGICRTLWRILGVQNSDTEDFVPDAIGVMA